VARTPEPKPDASSLDFSRWDNHSGGMCGSARNGSMLAFLSIATRISNDARNSLTIVLNDYRKYPQAHGSIVVVFHLEVFRVSLFIFSQRKAYCKRF
jgi:hypothetical protein